MATYEVGWLAFAPHSPYIVGFVRVLAPPFTPLCIDGNCLFEDSLNAKHMRVHGKAGLDAARSGIRMPNIMIDEFLLMIIIAGIGLAVAYLRAEYVVHRRFKAAEHEKLIIQRELRAARPVQC